MGLRPGKRVKKRTYRPKDDGRIVIDSMIDVPVSVLTDPQSAIMAFTVENGAWSPGSKAVRYFAEAVPVYRRPMINDLVLPSIEPVLERVRFPRNADLRGFIDAEAWAARDFVDEVSPVVYLNRRKLGTKVPGLGPNQWIQYDQKPAWEALIAPQELAPRPWGKIMVLACGRGKAILSSMPVVTENGWKEISDLDVGERIAGRDGEFHKVLGVYPQGEMGVYTFHFTDGTSIASTADHLWTFEMPRDYGRTVTMTTEQMLKKSLRGTSGRRFYLPMVEPVNFPEVDLPLDPYTLGVLLGDGHFNYDPQVNVFLTTSDEPILDLIRLPEGIRPTPLKHQSAGKATTYRIGPPRNGGVFKNPLLEFLIDSSLIYCKSWTKHVPEEFLWGSIPQRLALLQGLLDTDGTPKPSGTAEFCTTSPDLADAVVHLAQSLGGTASRGIPARKSFTYKGEKKLGRVAYRVVVKLPSGLPMFQLKRHLDRLPEVRQREPYRALDRISKGGKYDTTCIRIDADDHLFVTRDFIVTHNTVLSLRYAQEQMVRTIIVCHTLNMTQQWAQEAEDLLGVPRSKMGFIGNGKVDWAGKDIVFTSMPGLLCRQYPDSFWRYFGLAIFDEGDLLGAAEMRKILPKFVCERLLVTATLERQDGNEHLIHMHIGPVVFEDIEEDVHPKVEVHETPVPDFLPVEVLVKKKVQIQYRPAEKTIYSRRWRRQIANIPKTVTGLQRYKPRFYFTLEVVFELLEQGRKILFLGERVEEIQDLDELFTSECDTYSSGIFLGATHMKAEEGAAYLRDSDVTFAIQQLGKRGLNNRMVDTVLIQYATFNDPGKLRQMVGRALRYYPDKEYPKIVILVDMMVPCLLKNAEKIVDRLQDQGCEVEWYKYA